MRELVDPRAMFTPEQVSEVAARVLDDPPVEVPEPPPPQLWPLAVTIRPAVAYDLPLIYSSWINTLCEARPWAGCDRNWIAAAAHALISRLLARPTCQVFVACNPDHADQIYGYLVAEPRGDRLIHWVYTKKGTRAGLGFRCAGVATRLFTAAFGAEGSAPVTATCRTAPATTIAARWQGRWPIEFRSHALCEAKETQRG